MPVMQPEETEKRGESNLKSWLDGLQQESWQLELVISGILIFLLIGASGPIEALGQSLQIQVVTGGDMFVVLAAVYLLLKISYYALIGVFLIHLILRGFWIGAIGLRSVSGDFDFKVLDFQPRFTGWLQEQLKTFDDYIERLEGQCSVAFSMAFLFFFAIVSLGLFSAFSVGILLVLSAIFDWLGMGGTATKVILAFFNLFISLLGLIYLIDFSSLGWFKKRKWLQRVYFPFYRFMGWITLARFYRPFYYNLIDHPFGRKLVKRLWLIVLGGMLLSSVSLLNFPYFPVSTNDTTTRVSAYYLDAVPEGNMPILRPSLSSRHASGEDYLEIFVPYLPRQTDEVLEGLYPDLAPVRTRAYAIDGPIRLVNSLNSDANADSLLLAHVSLVRIYRNDSLLAEPGWQFYDHPVREQPGLVCDLPVYDLPRGQHNLRIERLELTATDSIAWSLDATINFVR